MKKKKQMNEVQKTINAIVDLNHKVLHTYDDEDALATRTGLAFV